MFVFKPIETEDLVILLKRAITDKRGFGDDNIKITEEALTIIAKFANGDARSALTTLDMIVINGEDNNGIIKISKETVTEEKVILEIVK